MFLYIIQSMQCWKNRNKLGCDFYFAVINELDGLKKDFQVDKYNPQHAQYVLENARYDKSV